MTSNDSIPMSSDGAAELHPPTATTDGSTTGLPAATGTTPGGGSGRRRPGAWVTIVLVVVGALAIAGTFAQSVASALTPLQPDVLESGWGEPGHGHGTWHGDKPWSGGYVEPQTVAVVPIDGVTSIDATTQSGELTVTYGDVTEATLEISGDEHGPEWSLAVDGPTLRLEQMSDPVSIGWSTWQSATLVLPATMEASRPALKLTTESGATVASGDFGDVTIALQSGQIDFTGSATTLGLSVETGFANVSAAGPTSLTLDVQSGTADVVVEGRKAPASTKVNVSSGYVSLDLPDGPYAVSEKVSSGSASIDLVRDPAAPNTVDVTVSSGGADID